MKTLPTVGETFTERVIEVTENGTIIAVPGFTQKKAIAVLKPGPGMPKYRAGKDSARVEVVGMWTLKSGLTVLDVKPGAKKET